MSHLKGVNHEWCYLFTHVCRKIDPFSMTSMQRSKKVGRGVQLGGWFSSLVSRAQVYIYPVAAMCSISRENGLSLPWEIPLVVHSLAPFTFWEPFRYYIRCTFRPKVRIPRFFPEWIIHLFLLHAVVPRAWRHGSIHLDVLSIKSRPLAEKGALWGKRKLNKASALITN